MDGDDLSRRSRLVAFPGNVSPHQDRVGAHFGAGGQNRRQRLRRLGRDDYGSSGLDDAGFVRRDLPDSIAKDRRVVEAD